MHGIPRSKPRLRRVFAAGRIPARRPTCRMGHRGPFVPVDAAYAAWMESMEAEFCLPRLRYVECRHCGSHTALPAGKVVEA